MPKFDAVALAVLDPCKAAVLVVPEMLGHSPVLLTLGTYSHVSPTMHREAAVKMDELFQEERELDTNLEECSAANLLPN